MSDLKDSQEGSRKVLLREIKTTPSVRQRFSFLSEGSELTVIRDEDPAKKRGRKRLNNLWETISTFLLSVFLPVGYPDSVSHDYLSYQLWNCLQDFCNSMTRVLATHAVLKGAGVGDAHATPLAATLTWLLKDATGMIGHIGFAYMQGSKFDSDSKKWRLFADVINDLATFLDLLSPFLSIGFTMTQCLSSIVKSCVGVAGGATRASVVQHQAKANNMADIQAKDGSQETLTNLVALACSLMVVPLVTGDVFRVWATYTFFTIIHLYANYRGIRHLNIPFLNMSRMGITVDRFLRQDKDSNLSVSDVNDSEQVWFFIPCLLSKRIKSGVSLSSHVKSVRHLQRLRNIFHHDKYMLSVDKNNREISISFDDSSDQMTTLEACFHAIILTLTVFDSNCQDYYGTRLNSLKKLSSSSQDEDNITLLTASQKLTKHLFPSFVTEIKKHGWDVSRCLVSRGDFRYKFAEEAPFDEGSF